MGQQSSQPRPRHSSPPGQRSQTATPVTPTVQARYCAELDAILKNTAINTAFNAIPGARHERFLETFERWFAEVEATYGRGTSQLEDAYYHILLTMLAEEIPTSVKQELVRRHASKPKWDSTQVMILLSMDMGDPQRESNQKLLLEALAEKPGLLRLKEEVAMQMLTASLVKKKWLTLLQNLIRVSALPATSRAFRHETLVALINETEGDDSDMAVELLCTFFDRIATSSHLQKMVCRKTTSAGGAYDDSSSSSSNGESSDDDNDTVGDVVESVAPLKAVRRRTLLYHTYCKCKKVWPLMQRVVERLVQDGFLLGRSDDVTNVLYLAAVRNDLPTLTWFQSLGIVRIDMFEALHRSPQCRGTTRDHVARILLEERAVASMKTT